MADSATVLVQGPAVLVERRQGTTRPTDGTAPRDYDFTTVRVLVENVGVTEVTLSDRMPAPIEGEPVCYLAEVRPMGGRGGVTVRALRVLDLATV